jgi:rhodanese-related sulfurtransferase/rubrerythrin
VRWIPFLTPVASLSNEELKHMMGDADPGTLTVLDVRQPNEYEAGHIPGAVLMPLPEIGERLHEIDAAKPTVVYCAVGGRSRVAAQILAGKGFQQVYNLSGGIRAYDSHTAIGPDDLGLPLFSGWETIEQTLIVAYSLEAGLHEFYQSMAQRSKNEKARNLFKELAGIEIKHQDRIFNAYVEVSGQPANRQEFESKKLAGVVEGGVSTKDYISRFRPDVESVTDIAGLAMSIEAQALDLYQRAAGRSDNAQLKKALLQIAEEEKRHLARLGELIEGLSS